MILVAGIPDERPTRMVIDALEDRGADYRLFDQRRSRGCDLELTIADADAGGRLDGVLTVDGEAIPLPAVNGAYVRLMDHRLLTAEDGGASEPARRHADRLHELLLRFADLAPGRILNRPSSMGSNHSKPLQAHAIREAGFDIPDTLITNDPESAQRFIERAWSNGGAVVYKSISGVRSIVQTVIPADLDRLPRIRWCPTQFQAHVGGTDVRVHVVGRQVFAARIDSTATDYRYAVRQVGEEARICAVDLEPAVASACIRLSERLDLPLAGIDLRHTPDGRWVCFEVNPSPAFSFYQAGSGLPIAAAIAAHLTGDAD